MWKVLTVFLISTFAIPNTQGFAQEPFLVFLFNETDRLIDGYRVTNEIRELPLFVNSAKRLCARGMWTLFTAPHFGELQDTTVYSVHSRGDISCTAGSVAPIISEIKSLRPLAGLGVRSDSCVSFNRTNFVGPPLACSGASWLEVAGSFAVYSETYHMMICNTTTIQSPPTTDCVCMNGVVSGSYMVPDTSNFPQLQGKLLYGVWDRTVCGTFPAVEVPVQSELEIVNLGLSPNNPTRFDSNLQA